MVKGNGYLGSSELMVSTANQEIIPQHPTDWTEGYRCYKLSFLNQQATKIIINNKTEIYLDALQGFEMNYPDKSITSFVIVNPDVTYQYIAGY